MAPATPWRQLISREEDNGSFLFNFQAPQHNSKVFAIIETKETAQLAKQILSLPVLMHRECTGRWRLHSMSKRTEGHIDKLTRESSTTFFLPFGGRAATTHQRHHGGKTALKNDI